MNLPYPKPRPEILIAYLAAMATAVHALETILPGIGPWFKPGLANIFTLTAYILLGFKYAVMVTLIRIIVSSLALGTFLTPGFFLSLSGALLALSVMALFRYNKKLFSVVSISLVASLAHMGGQILAAYLLIFRHPGIFQWASWFFITAWVTGVINGLLAAEMIARLKKTMHAPLSFKK
ncbi:Gx transporter family protein [Magnetococcales bacterium HHB-1]